MSWRIRLHHWLMAVALTCVILHVRTLRSLTLVGTHITHNDIGSMDVIGATNAAHVVNHTSQQHVRHGISGSILDERSAVIVLPTAANKIEAMNRSYDKEHDNGLPYFVLHVGPHKAASTTLQCSMQRDHNSLLKRDNYCILETANCRPNVRPNEKNILNGWGQLPNCLNELNEVEVNGTLPDCWKEYMDVFDDLRQHGKNIVISDETISRTEKGLNNTPRFVDHLKKSLTGFQVVVVVVYRRWFEWLPSCRNQVFKPHPQKQRLHWWPDKVTSRRGGRLIPAMDEYLLHVLGKHAKYAFVPTILEAFRGKIDIRILNIHAGDVETNFYCKVLPGAVRTCRAMLNRNASMVNRENAGVPLDYDILTTAAHSRGLIANETLGRVPIGSLAKNFHEKKLGQSEEDLPKVCPPINITNQVLERSVYLEKLVMPVELHAMLEEQHRTAFAEAMERKRLCTIDVDKALENEAWVNFYRNPYPV